MDNNLLAALVAVAILLILVGGLFLGMKGVRDYLPLEEEDTEVK